MGSGSESSVADEERPAEDRLGGAALSPSAQGRCAAPRPVNVARGGGRVSICAPVGRGSAVRFPAPPALTIPTGPAGDMDIILIL